MVTQAVSVRLRIRVSVWLNLCVAVATLSVLACDRNRARFAADAAARPPARMITGAGANQSTSPHTGALDEVASVRIAAHPEDASAGVPDALSHDEVLVGEEPERDPWSDTIKVKVQVAERRQAHVVWGRKDFGVAPLEIERPRNSGPLDLVVIAPGYLPYHARAFTDRDDTISVHLYSAAEAPQLLGYRASEVPPPSVSAPSSASARAPATSAPATNQNRQKPR